MAVQISTAGRRRRRRRHMDHMLHLDRPLSGHGVPRHMHPAWIRGHHWRQQTPWSCQHMYCGGCLSSILHEARQYRGIEVQGSRKPPAAKTSGHRQDVTAPLRGAPLGAPQHGAAAVQRARVQPPIRLQAPEGDRGAGFGLDRQSLHRARRVAVCCLVRRHLDIGEHLRMVCTSLLLTWLACGCVDFMLRWHAAANKQPGRL